MIPVEQTILGGDSTMSGIHGDCLRACVASVFELPIEDVPHFVGEDDWWNAWRRWTEDRGFILGNAFHRFEDDDPTHLNGYPSEGIYWIATVKSPRLVKEDGTPGLHVVVMRGGELVWDPHPGPKKGEHLGFVGLGYTFVAPDPAQLQRRPTVDPAPVVAAARRYVAVGPEAIPALTEDAHFQLLRAVTQYNARLEAAGVKLFRSSSSHPTPRPPNRKEATMSDEKTTTTTETTPPAPTPWPAPAPAPDETTTTTTTTETDKPDK